MTYAIISSSSFQQNNTKNHGYIYNHKTSIQSPRSVNGENNNYLAILSYNEDIVNIVP